MTDNPAGDRLRHPHWCDLAECTAHRPGGPHCSTVMTLGPLPNTRLTVRAHLFAIEGVPVPAALLSLHSPLFHPEDIVDAGATEDVSSVVLPPDQLALLSTFLGGLHELVDE